MSIGAFTQCLLKFSKVENFLIDTRLPVAVRRLAEITPEISSMFLTNYLLFYFFFFKSENPFIISDDFRRTNPLLKNSQDLGQTGGVEMGGKGVGTWRET